MILLILPQGLNTFIGERGMRMSEGKRLAQREPFILTKKL